MEFEFVRNTLMGEYYVKCSMGHEIVGRWLQEDIGKNQESIQQVLDLIEQAKQHPSKEFKLSGREISLSIQQFDVLVEEHVLTQEQELDSEEFDFYNSESTATCGLEDFHSLIEQWQEFVQPPRSYRRR